MLACADAGESAAIVAYRQAMQGDDAIAKREAVRALISKDAGDDDTVLPLLVEALQDRQAREAAIQALRARTGLRPPARQGASSYPGYPSDDTPAAWQAWLAARARDLETKRRLETIDRRLQPPPAPAAASSETTASEVQQAAVSEPTLAPRIPTESLGRLDRIVYKSGRSLIAYVRTRRLDADGNLLSIRVVHRDGIGEEVIDAALIARIDEDIE
ncbi:MAG: hypothetical protein N2690_01630 [Rhodocyclaceae bacterium]|nr:hypothetical protein [Rhodocyclaceae bacterium]